MSDSAFPTAAFPAYGIDELRSWLKEPKPHHTPHFKKMVAAEITRREKVAAGDRSQMTQGERLRHARAN